MKAENNEVKEWWNGTVKGVTVEYFNGNAYIRLREYETLLIELQALENELEELKI